MNQFVGADFEGTPINQLIGNNNNYSNMNNGFGNMNGGYMEPPASTLFQQPSRDIRNLVSNINNQLDNVSFNASNHSQESRKSKYQDNTTSEEEAEAKRKLKKKLKKRKEKKRKMEQEEDEEEHRTFFEWTKYLSNDTKELLLIITIYFILSLGFVKKTVGEYISVINPNESGKYPFIGVLIYGFLLAVLFIAFKKVLIE